MGVRIVGLTAFVVSGGTVSFRNVNSRCHHDDIVGGQAGDLDDIVYTVHNHDLVGANTY